MSDKNGSIPGAIVKIKGTETFTTTNFEGKYTINVKEGDVLVYTFMGMEEATKNVGESSVINVVLNDDNTLLGEIGVINRKKTFMGRIFHRIGNWFR
ncbi:carboxypeptidase-like regulatory domain-containing protein [Flavobacterium oreochromis]|uniref:carboxypeptidase-like regulatory domain-containing protein n=1 Tax=Flavobacterium oreochromis TaxID=2906078 RepID=UPI001CE4E943|nr:carboxypeptidase-like regulatory domain-containing protein [Flavobacterium oreochromis]QYS87624.1 carboxypeptidase-like regulatory domain-containing protein [Flavobacterium oreochromis]